MTNNDFSDTDSNIWKFLIDFKETIRQNVYLHLKHLKLRVRLGQNWLQRHPNPCSLGAQIVFKANNGGRKSCDPGLFKLLTLKSCKPKYSICKNRKKTNVLLLKVHVHKKNSERLHIFVSAEACATFWRIKASGILKYFHNYSLCHGQVRYSYYSYHF